MIYRIVIAEDHALFRDGLSSLLSSKPELKVVGQAADGLEAIRLVGEYQPDLLLLDLSMPKLGGLEAMNKVKEISPGTRILVVSMHGTDKHLRAAFNAGADGYLLKMADQNEFYLAIKAVIEGKKYVSSEFTSQVMQAFLTSGTEISSPLEKLTARERETLKLAAEGYTNKQIAKMLFISPKTVDKHRTSLMNKLNLHNILELNSFARRHGLIDDVSFL